MQRKIMPTRNIEIIKPTNFLQDSLKNLIDMQSKNNIPELQTN